MFLSLFEKTLSKSGRKKSQAIKKTFRTTKYYTKKETLLYFRSSDIPIHSVLHQNREWSIIVKFTLKICRLLCWSCGWLWHRHLFLLFASCIDACSDCLLALLCIALPNVYWNSEGQSLFLLSVTSGFNLQPSGIEVTYLLFKILMPPCVLANILGRLLNE